MTYQAAFDMKIEDVINDAASGGADVIIRYRDSQKAYLTSKDVLIDNNDYRANRAWCHEVRDFTPPTGAAYAEIGFYIGIISTVNANPDMKHTFANIAIAKADDTTFWDEYDNKRPQTDLLFVMTKPENESTVKDLIDIKKGAGNDMNLSGRINEDDANIMRWKLTGVTKSSELRR